MPGAEALHSTCLDTDEESTTSPCQTGGVTGKRNRVIAIAVAVGVIAAAVAVPTVVIADHLITQSLGRTTVVTDADGTEQTFYWREYPGVAGLDPEDLLDGPSVDEGYELGTTMAAEMRAALTAEFRLQWTPDPNAGNGNGPFFEQVPNGFGGESLLTTINAPASQSTSVPPSWADKERVIEIISDVAAGYGFGPVILDHERYPTPSKEERIRDWGGATPETQVLVTGFLEGPTGQWLWFSLQDLSKDSTGEFAERLGPATDYGWEPNSVNISYGANGLLPDEHRAEFEQRLRPFVGLTPPEPLET